MRKVFKVYIADDEPLDAKIYSKFFLDNNWQAKTFPNGQDLLFELEKGTLPDLILCDKFMPTNGFEVISYLKTLREYKDIPVVLISSSFSAEERSAAEKAGLFEYFEKPTQLSTLQKMIDSLVDRISKANMAF